jgi:geranylgeranyl diphosphate synthase type I
MGIPDCLNKYQELIIRDMHDFLDGSTRPHVKMIYYHLGWLDKSFNEINDGPGKLSRPSIALLVAEVLGGNIEKTLPAAISLQIFHEFTLMHDDIEDGDSMRRHRETVWKNWGIPRAINAGDAMYTYSLQAILRVSKNRETLLAYLLDVFQEIVFGQELDLSFVYLPVSKVSTDDYMKMISGKSATLLGASAKVGALMSDATEKVQNEFYNFGFNLGIAYQVFDDYVSIWGDQKRSGKIAHMDIVDKK